MLVTMDPSSGSQSRGPSIMDSPTLARVERARIRLEVQAMNNNENHSLDQRIIDSKVSHSYKNDFIFLYMSKCIFLYGCCCRFYISDCNRLTH